MANQECLRRCGWLLPALVSVALHGLALGCWGLATCVSSVESSSQPATIECCLIEEPASAEPGPTVHKPPQTAAVARKTHLHEPAMAGPFSASLRQAAFLTESPGEGAIAASRPVPGQASFFQVKASGARILYVIDCSASMGNGALTAASAELCRSIAALPPTSRFQVIVFNSRASLLMPAKNAWLSPDPQTIDEVRTAIAAVSAEGRTEYRPALSLALAMGPDAVFLLTDGSGLQTRDLTAIGMMNRNRTPIHVINLRARAGTPLRNLAEANACAAWNGWARRANACLL